MITGKAVNMQGLLHHALLTISHFRGQYLTFILLDHAEVD